PSQDMIMGCYYLTKQRGLSKGEDRVFSSKQEVLVAHDHDEADLQARIRVRVDGEIITTTVGRVVFYQIVPDAIPFARVNQPMGKRELTDLVNQSYLMAGKERTVTFIDDLKNMGFRYATLSGISISINDMIIPESKGELVERARHEVVEVEQQYRDGLITNGERYNKIIDIWANVTEQVADEMFKELELQDEQIMEGRVPERAEGRPEFNPLYIMADSGARGSLAQIRQLAGMRGLMAKPSGEIIETPITANFREGLTVLQYFISTHGARKGLADTALKTANSGYLTRRLVDVAQDIIILEVDCETLNGIEVSALVEGGEIIMPLEERILGRNAPEEILDPFTNEVLVKANEEIDEAACERVINAGLEKVHIRSVLSCEAEEGVCSMCYGRNLATGFLVEIGEAVGVIAAQSIGEPGTQLTMRTFHVGGTASRVVEQTTLEAKRSGFIKYQNLRTVTNVHNEIIVMNRNGSIAIVDEQGRERERYPLVYGARLKVKDGQKVPEGERLVEWDPFTMSILTDVSGTVAFRDIIDGVTVKEELDEVTGLSRKVIMESAEEKRQPRLSIKDAKNKTVGRYILPAGAHLAVAEAEPVSAGAVLAKIPRETTKTKDITGGLPRVAELFEARKPKEQAIISEIDGVVKFGPITKGMRKVIITNEQGEEREYLIPRGKHVNVHEGDGVKAGEPLMDGAANPHDILDVLGEKELQKYLVNEVQQVYRLQGVNIHDKHIEVIVRQMLKRIVVEDAGDTDFLVDEQVSKAAFEKANDLVQAKKGTPAAGRPILMGITKSSLSTDSFISAASFQETTRVMTQAAVSGAVD
ncbi:MAG: DNA-directed RNA polymerase subunit beta', partial [bacterium]